MDTKACDDFADVLQDLHLLLWQHKQLVLDDVNADVTLWKELQTLPAKVTPSFQLATAPAQNQVPLAPLLPQKLLESERRTSGSLPSSDSSSGKELSGFSASHSLMGKPKHLVAENTNCTQKPQAQPPKPTAATLPKPAASVKQADKLAHAQGTCKPCLFFSKGVCFKKKSDCCFCHLPHDMAQIRHVRPSKGTRLCLEKRSVQRKQDFERKYGKHKLANA